MSHVVAALVVAFGCSAVVLALVLLLARLSGAARARKREEKRHELRVLLLTALRSPEAVRPLLEAVVADALARDVVAAIARTGAPASPSLRGMLEEVLVAGHRPPSPIPGAPPVRRAEVAATGLGMVGDVGACSPLVRAVRDTEHPGLAEAAADALGRLGSPEAVEPLLDVLTGAQPGLRLAVARALGNISDRSADGRVAFVSEPVAWTEAPEGRPVLRRQRRRWHRGLTEILGRHRAMVLRSRYGVVGLISLPWLVVFELAAPFLELFSAAYLLLVLAWRGAEQLGWVPTDLVDLSMAWALLTASVLYSTVLTLGALLLEEFSYRRYRRIKDLFAAVVAALLESLGYRQLTAWWRVGGTVEALRSSDRHWGDMQRRGLGSA